MSNDEWDFIDDQDNTSYKLFYIENISKNKVLGAFNDGKVILEDLDKDVTGQLWYKETFYAPNEKGFFLIKNSFYGGILFPLLIENESVLYVIGNISLSWIVKKLIVDNLPCFSFKYVKRLHHILLDC